MQDEHVDPLQQVHVARLHTDEGRRRSDRLRAARVGTHGRDYEVNFVGFQEWNVLLGPHLYQLELNAEVRGDLRRHYTDRGLERQRMLQSICLQNAHP